MANPLPVRGKNQFRFACWGATITIVAAMIASIAVPAVFQRRAIQRMIALGAVTVSEDSAFWGHVLHLAGLKSPGWRLIRLQVQSGTSIEQCDAILGIAAGMSSLRELDLTDSPVADENLSIVKAWPELRIVSLSNTRITNRCLQHLTSASRLTSLTFSNCQIDDSGLIDIAMLTQLETLDLGGTRISDSGLKHLKSLKNLRALGLSNTQVSELAVEELLRSLPHLAVTDD